MRRLALCLILGVIFAQPARAEAVDCSSQSTARLAVLLGFKCRSASASVQNLKPSPEIMRLVSLNARRTKIDPGLVLAVIAAESAFDQEAISPRNAMGLMQLIPETVTRFGVTDPFDPAENIRGGTSYLQVLLQKFGSVKLALAAYNAGEEPILAYGAVPPYEETTTYVDRVLRYYDRYKLIDFGQNPPPEAGFIKTLPARRCGPICRGGK